MSAGWSIHLLVDVSRPCRRRTASSAIGRRPASSTPSARAVAARALRATEAAVVPATHDRQLRRDVSSWPRFELEVALRQ
ncbi:hypothetical protein FGD71_020955 [Streptomyces sporangiiformans]|uniref:Uncharacterized protein n=1 Tax=Streptomyces sporangiiformans TaxID=2315329 RepID=A0A505DKI2_9ACTN|nr:hypothetical protein FGD71_020955 [Streptomyces sporangiiformans]